MCIKDKTKVEVQDLGVVVVVQNNFFHVLVVPFLQLHRGKNPLDLIAPGSRLELQNFRDSLEAWIVNVVENVGGRLKLRYEGLEDSDKFDRWIFYLDPFLHQVGWATQNGYNLQPPLGTSKLISFIR